MKRLRMWIGRFYHRLRLYFVYDYTWAQTAFWGKPDPVSEAQMKWAREQIAKLGLFVLLLCSVLPGMAQDGFVHEGRVFHIPTTVSELAAEELAAEPDSGRLKAQIAEAKEMLREKAKIEKRIAEIQARLTALDNDAEPKKLTMGITETGLIQPCFSFGKAAPMAGGTDEPFKYNHARDVRGTGGLGFGTTLEWPMRLPEDR